MADTDKNQEPQLVTAENTTDGPRAVFTGEGYVTIEKGTKRVVSVSKADQDANKDFFKFSSASQKDADDHVEADGPGELDRLNPVEPLPEAEDDTYKAMSDEQLRDEIEDKPGKRPHANTSRTKLIEAHKKATNA